MAIKFSQFVLKTLPSELDFIVGYTGTENLQITPDVQLYFDPSNAANQDLQAAFGLRLGMFF